ncbi:MAG: hypothetical protein R3E50_17430 [Halioglobus sp.]
MKITQHPLSESGNSPKARQFLTSAGRIVYTPGHTAAMVPIEPPTRVSEEKSGTGGNKALSGWLMINLTA